ncbi:hypothetical protein LXA43DRAFT_1023780 [Ganoderma leucocontextum]|nr:hypothetical protein LXA43DRAFT_1023780 [Ganoderma leucocontextum]
MCDIVIAAALCYYLHSKRTEFRGTNSMIDRLIIYAVNRGALTALCQTGEMITAIARPDRYIYVPFGILSGKLYCNTLLATINAQKSIRKDGNNIIEVGSLPNFRMDTTSGGHGNSESRTTRRSLDNINVACFDMPTFVIDISKSSDKTAVRTLLVFQARP